MNDMLKLLLLSLALFIGLAAIDHFVMPPTAPVAWGNDPQPLWQVEIAFLLRALENISALIAIVIILLAAAFYIQRRVRPDAQS
jgi:hypothetical protein